MNPRPSVLIIKRCIIGIGLLGLGLLGGCSAFKLGYGQGPTLAHWWLDGYVDFDSNQSQRVRDELQRWFAWHQQSQLTVYAAHLGQLRAEAAQPVSGERLCRWTDATRDLLVPALERTLPAAAEVVLTLTPAQLDRLHTRYQERTAKMRSEMLMPDPKGRHEAALDRTVKRYEDFYGKLSTQQRQLIDTRLRAAPVDPATAMDRREKRHAEMMTELRAIVRDRPAVAQVQERLRLLVRRFDGRSPVEPAQQARAMAEANCELAARVHNSATAQQRQALAEKLRAWESDLRALAGNGSALAGSGRSMPLAFAQ
jgi:hypothetical protein